MKGLIYISSLLLVLWTLSLSCHNLCIKRHWAEIPQFLMATTRIVVALSIVEHARLGVRGGSENLDSGDK